MRVERLKAPSLSLALAFVVALCFAQLSLASGSGSAADASVVDASEDGFVAQMVAVDVAAATDPVGELGEFSGLAASRSLASSTIAFDHQPQILSIDTHDRTGTLLVRSLNAGQWSEWISVSTSLEEAPDGLPGEEGFETGVPVIGPIWVGEETEAAEVIVVDGDITEFTVQGLATTPDQREIDAAVAAQASAAASIDGTPLDLALASQPTIQPRSSWATRGWTQHPGCPASPSVSDNIEAMVVHHTVTSNNYTAADTPAIMRSIYRFHVDSNRWCDIAYNFIVDRFGTIWEARTGSLAEPVISGATLGFNTNTLSVAVLGQYQQGASPAAISPTSATVDAISRLGAWRLAQFGVDPNGSVTLKSRTSSSSAKFPGGSWVTVPTILGHRDLGTSSCPGSLLYVRIGGIGQYITGVRDYSVPVNLPGRTPAPSGPAVLLASSDGAIRPAGAADVVDAAPSATSTPVIAISGTGGKGYLLTADGSVVGFGGNGSHGKPAGANAVDIVVDSSGTRGWVLESSGRLRGFNGAPNRTPAGFGGQAVAAIHTSGNSGYVLNSNGVVSPFGGAASVQTQAGGVASGTAIDVGLGTNGNGAPSGWVLEQSGTLRSFGGAPAYQSALHGAGGSRAQAIVGDPGGHGGWVADSEGRLHPFGSPRPVQPISTTVGRPTVVDAALWWELPADQAATGDGRFVDSLHTLFLGRSASALEIEHNIWDLDYRGRNALVEGFASSDEWAGAIVDDIYRDILGRPADAAGRAYWVQRLRDGLTTQMLGAQFYASPEYVQAAGSNDAYVTRLYRALLDREPDAAGLAYWSGQLRSGRPPAQITLGFYQSPESRTGRVTNLYRKILRRGPDADGLAFWSERLLVEDDIALAAELASSVEYYYLVAD